MVKKRKPKPTRHHVKERHLDLSFGFKYWKNAYKSNKLPTGKEIVLLSSVLQTGIAFSEFCGKVTLALHR